MFILNSSFYTKSLIFSTFIFLKNLRLNIKNFHFIFSKISRISLSEIGIVNNFKMPSIYLKNNFVNNSSKSIFYFCGVDLDTIYLNLFLQNSFIIYQGYFYHTFLNILI